MIVDIDYIPIRRLIGAWSHCIRVTGAHCRVQGASAKAVQRYICKYATKAGPDELKVEEIVDWFEAIRGSRLWASWGAWYGKEAKAALADSEIFEGGKACPYCGMVHSVFLPCQGRKIYGDSWDAIRRAMCLPEEWERKIPPGEIGIL